jgi:hypothetical protein
MSKHVPDTAAANTALATAREPSRRDHLPCQVRHLDEIDWETIRWPGETGKMLSHPSPEQPTAPNAGIRRLEPGAHHPEHYHGFAQVARRRDAVPDEKHDDRADRRGDEARAHASKALLVIWVRHRRRAINPWTPCPCRPP